MRYMEIERDLFSLPSYYLLAHCIAVDAKMGAGIAEQFVRHYPDMREFIEGSNPEIGQAIYYTDLHRTEKHPVVNLITKQSSYVKPTRTDFNTSLTELANLTKELKITKLGIPKIGSGLDKLSWSETKEVIHQLFGDQEIDICVCLFKPTGYQWR